MTKQISGQDVAERIHSARKIEGRSVSSISELSGIADKTLRRRLANPDQFTLAELSSIANVLHCTLEDLLSVSAAQVAVA